MRKMASKTFLAVMLLIVVFFISGCGSSNGGNVKKAAYEIIDDQGAMIQLEHKPERILTLAMGTDSIVLGILPEEKLIAINSLADDPVSSNIVDKANGITRKIKNPSADILTCVHKFLPAGGFYYMFYLSKQKNFSKNTAAPS